MTSEELRTRPTELEIAKAIACCGTIGAEMIRRLAFQLDIKEQLIKRAVIGLKNIGEFHYRDGDEPHPLDCSLAGRVSHVFGMGMTRSVMLVRHCGEEPSYVSNYLPDDEE